MLQIDSENVNRDLTSTVTVLTHTPSATDPMLCVGEIVIGDGVDDLDGSGGDFELTLMVDGVIVDAVQIKTVEASTLRTRFFTIEFPVPANTQVIMRVKSPNAGDADVNVIAKLYQTDNVESLSSITTTLAVISAAIATLAASVATGFATVGTAINAVPLSVWNVLTSALATIGSIGKWLLDNSGSGSGNGAFDIILTITDDDDIPIANCDVVLTTVDTAPTVGITATGETNGSGRVTFFLDEGTYYVWKQKSGIDFSQNPETILVDSDGNVVEG